VNKTAASLDKKRSDLGHLLCRQAAPSGATFQKLCCFLLRNSVMNRVLNIAGTYRVSPAPWTWRSHRKLLGRTRLSHAC